MRTHWDSFGSSLPRLFELKSEVKLEPESKQLMRFHRMASCLGFCGWNSILSRFQRQRDKVQNVMMRFNALVSTGNVIGRLLLGQMKYSRTRRHDSSVHQRVALTSSNWQNSKIKKGRHRIRLWLLNSQQSHQMCGSFQDFIDFCVCWESETQKESNWSFYLAWS